jgi:hypothetical protein
MHLLELPTELVDVILEWCVRVRCLKRALRLRLVNRKGVPFAPVNGLTFIRPVFCQSNSGDM